MGAVVAAVLVTSAILGYANVRRLAAGIDPLTGDHFSYFATVGSLVMSVLTGILLLGLAFYLGRQNRAYRERAARATDDAAELVRTTLSSIGDGVISVDRQGRILFLNPAAEQMTGWGREAATGLPLAEVFRIVDGGTRQAVPGPVADPLSRGWTDTEQLDRIVIARDGTERSVDSRTAPILSRSREVVGAVLVFRDNSVRKAAARQIAEASSRLESTLAAGEVGTWEFDIVGNSVRADRNLARMFGVGETASDGLPLELFTGAIHPDDRDRVGRAIGAAIESGETFEAEYRVIGEHRTERWIVARGRVERDAAGRAIRLPGVAVDLSGQRRAESQLRASEERRRLALEAAELGSWNIDAASLTLTTDARCRQIFQGSAAPITFEGAFAAIHPDDRPRVQERVLAALHAEAPTPFSEEYRVRHPDGSEHWVFGKGGPHFETREGKPRLVSLDGTVSDVTDRRQASDRLRQSEERFRTLFNSMDEGFCVVEMLFDETGKAVDYLFVETNAAFEQQCGLRDVVGKTIRQIVPDHDEHWFQIYGEVARTGEPRRLVETGTAMGGWWWDVYAFRLGDQESRKVAVLFSDITPRVRMEQERQRLAVLSEHSTDFVATCDLDLQPTFLNRAGRSLVGLDTEERVRATPLRDYFFPEDSARVFDRFFPAVIEQGSGEIEIRLRHFGTGRAIWMLYRVFVIPDRDGNPSSLAVVGRDITDRKELENHLRQLAADLSEGDRRKNEFLATLAHELRNPLAPIRNGLQLMRLAAEDREIVDQARQMMDRQLDQMVRLVDDLMDVSRITRGKLELKRERLALADVIQSAVETSRPLIEQMGHDLTLSLPAETIYVEADMTRLAQIFQNLLNNAAKYSEPRGRIRLSVQRTEGEVAISVVDEGIGLAADQIPKIFELFTQVDRSLEKAQGGLGIGLSLVKRLVDMHGGEIEVESAGIGQGSEFTVRLPVADVGPTAAAVASEANGDAGNSLRILIVDDNRDGANSLASMLSLLGSETRTAYDGEEAVAAAAEFDPDVILLDLGLPRLNGYEACQRIRSTAAGRSKLIIAQTGWGQDEDRRRTQEAGFDLHLVKPVDAAALARLLAERKPGSPPPGPRI